MYVKYFYQVSKGLIKGWRSDEQAMGTFYTQQRKDDVIVMSFSS